MNNNKNTIIGFILIGLIFIGYTLYQSKLASKEAALKAKSEAQKKDVVKPAEDSSKNLNLSSNTATNPSDNKDNASSQERYSNTFLEAATKSKVDTIALSNDKLNLLFTTKGAQLLSAEIKKYKTYDKTPLYLFKAGGSKYNIIFYTRNTGVNTSDLNFRLVEKTDSSLTMRLYFSENQYIQQVYTLKKNSYSLSNKLSFVNMNGLIPNTETFFRTKWDVSIPRMERTYKNEAMYSKIDYYFPGDSKPEYIGDGRDKSVDVQNKLSWFAFQQQFFSAIIRAESNFSSGSFDVKFNQELANQIAKEGQKVDNAILMYCKANMRNDFPSNMTANMEYKYDYYLGPNSYNILKTYGHKYENIIPLGGFIIGWFTKLLIIPIFNFLNNFIGNYGLIILLMTLIIKIIVFPFTFKSYSSMAKMQVLKPEIDKINEKYPKKEDAMAKQQATMALYKRAGVSPLGGCLPMLLQLPIIWAMFRFFPASIELRQQHFLWATDLSSYESIIHFPFNLPLIGNHLSLFALLTAISMVFYSKLTGQQVSGSDPNAKMMKIMSLWFMPIFIFIVSNNLSSALCYYYFLSTSIGVVESMIIKKFFVHPDKIMQRLKETEGKPIQKSKFQLRLEQAQKMQQERNKKK